MIGLLGIIVVYSKQIALDWTTLAACIFIFIVANIVTYALYYMIPSYKPPLQRIFTSEDLENERKKEKEHKKN